jgi:uncharacterized protein YbaR (Trm112 family)
MKKGFKFSGGDWSCPFCGKKLKSHQGVHGHIMFAHGQGALDEWLAKERDERRKTASGASLPDTKALKTELEALELQEKLAALKAKQADRTRIPDLAEQAGLGPMQPDVAAQVQSRAFGAPQLQPKTDWLSVLSSPNLPLVLNALKGALGVGQSDSVATVLRDMGLSLPDLIKAAVSPPKRVDGLVLGGIDLSGTPLTPEMFTAILQYRASEEKVKLESESRKEMTESLDRLTTLLAPVIGEKFGGATKTGGSVSRKGEESEILTCPLCNRENVVPSNISPGQVIRCATGGCTQEWTAESTRTERPAAKKKREAKVKQLEPETLACPGCKQSIDVTGRSIGDVIRCPICDHEVKLISEEESVPAAEPLSELEKVQRGWRGKRLNG